ncbi:MAG: hypothetical protein WC736_15780 [Gallionella sp.]|jgi:hypothetical protein
MKYFIVWNESKTEAFVTVDAGLAYEVRKSADSNCVDADGRHSETAVAFCNDWFEDNCTIEEREL